MSQVLGELEMSRFSSIVFITLLTASSGTIGSPSHSLTQRTHLLSSNHDHHKAISPTHTHTVNKETAADNHISGSSSLGEWSHNKSNSQSHSTHHKPTHSFSLIHTTVTLSSVATLSGSSSLLDKYGGHTSVGSSATVLLNDCRHSMTIYGSDFIRTTLMQSSSNSPMRSMSDSRTRHFTQSTLSTVMNQSHTVTVLDSHTPHAVSSSVPKPHLRTTPTIHITNSSVSIQVTMPPSSGGIPQQYRLVLYTVPPVAAVICCLVSLASCLGLRRYRKLRRYRRQLIPLTDRDGSSDSEEEEELEYREPAFLVTPMSKPMLAFADT